VSRPKLIVAVALSVALVGALMLSLVRGGGSPRAQPATAGRNPFFGIIQGLRLDAQDFTTMAATGVGSDRFLLIWKSVQPQRGGPYNWGPTDALVGGFARHGIRPLPTVWGDPQWVAGPSVQPPLSRPQDLRAWRAFLKAAVARYGPGGTFWTTTYRQRYGDSAAPLPITAWQIWNEPNLPKYFAPGPSPTEYARLLRISHDVIKSQDPNAQIVLAGMPGYGQVNAWNFLQSLYAIPGIKKYFDAVALHPYAPDIKTLKLEIERMRAVMKKNGDASTPLWITEMGWGSAPPDRFGINQGLKGQQKMLLGSFKLILSHRQQWNIQRVFWFDWRDPPKGGIVKCSFCASAGLLRNNRTFKPAYGTYRFFATAP
jgi:hypothetical protein